MNLSMALITLDGLIAGIESHSSIPVQLSELNMLKLLLTSNAPGAGYKNNPVLPVTIAQYYKEHVEPVTVTQQSMVCPNCTGGLACTYPTCRSKAEQQQIADEVVAALYTGTIKAQSALRAVPSGLWPTLDSVKSVIDLALSQFPGNDKNAVMSLLMIMHNTVIQEVSRTKHIQD